MSKRSIRCACCDRFGEYGAYDWCSACFRRWLRADRPEEGPPPRPIGDRAAPGRVAHMAAAQGRREDYQELRSWGETREMAAQRVGVTERTVWRYERAQRELATAGKVGAR